MYLRAQAEVDRGVDRDLNRDVDYLRAQEACEVGAAGVAEARVQLLGHGGAAEEGSALQHQHVHACTTRGGTAAWWVQGA